MKMLSINKEKRIGQVIYVVEGDVFEVGLLQHIYCGVLGYEVVSYDKRCGKCTCLVGSGDKYSRVYIVPAEYSAIKKLDDSEDYFGEVYSMLSESYGLDAESSALYFIFDRDRKSNRTKAVSNALDKYVNARDGIGYERNGLILLSYPSLEAVLLNCKNDNTRFDSGKGIKEYVKNNKMEITGITEEEIRIGSEVVKQFIECITGTDFEPQLLDNFANVNKAIFNEQEALYVKDRLYYTLSLILISLMDLGIVWMDDC